MKNSYILQKLLSANLNTTLGKILELKSSVGIRSLTSFLDPTGRIQVDLLIAVHFFFVTM